MDKPRVKPLEWNEYPRGGWKRGRISGFSPSDKAEATIFRCSNGWQYMGDVYLNAHDNLDAALDRAKAAAQADYEARILAALEPVTVREAARVLLAEHERCAQIPTQDRTPKEQRLATMGRNRLRALAERGE